MAFTSNYVASEPSRADVDSRPGITLLEFGAPWCGHCISAQMLIEHALSDRADIEHIKIEDGRGKALGRSFQVKLWPTLVVMQDGEEVGRAVRPRSMAEIVRLLPPAE